MQRFSILLLLFFVSCEYIDSKEGGSKASSYSFTCLDSTVSNKPLNKGLKRAGDLIRDLAVSREKISDSMETAYGDMFHKDMQETDEGFKVINDSKLQAQLDGVLNRLLQARQKPSGVRYKIFPVEDTVVNAYTFGGRIYITRGMLNKCKREDLLYAIIGHEIGHTEMGHIKMTIQEMMLTEKIFGEENGVTAFSLKRLLTASFNQRNEVEADYYGIDLTNSLGYDVCTAVEFWSSMAVAENNYSQLEDFFRTHPFSSLRSDCLINHIRTNFGTSCSVKK